MKIDFEKASFKDFENPVGMDAYERASYFNEFLDFLQGRGHLNFNPDSIKCMTFGLRVSDAQINAFISNFNADFRNIKFK